VRYKIDVVNESGLVEEHVYTDSYMLLYDDGGGRIRTVGNLLKQLVIDKVGSNVRAFIGSVVDNARGGRK